MMPTQHLTRRELAGSLASAWVLATAPVALADAHAQSPARKSRTEGRFAHKPAIVHLNAAHLCPMPFEVSAALKRADDSIDACPSQLNEDFMSGERERLRARLALSIGARSADDIALLRNTTEANNLLINGYPFKRRDEVVLWDENHASNNLAWDVRAQRDRIRVRRVSLPRGVSSAAEIVDAFAAAITPKTRVLALTHVSNVSGFKLPVADLCALARDRKIFVHVDGAQTWGAEPLDLLKMGCSSFSGSAHKWLMGPREVGLLYMTSRHVPNVWPSIVGLDWDSDSPALRGGARKFECLGQRDDAAMPAMHAALDLQEAMQSDAVRENAARWFSAVAAEADRLGIELVSPRIAAFRSSIIVLRVEERRRAAVARRLYEGHRVTVSTRGGIRLSPHVYNDDNDLDRFIEALRALRSDGEV